MAEAEGSLEWREDEGTTTVRSPRTPVAPVCPISFAFLRFLSKRDTCWGCSPYVWMPRRGSSDARGKRR